MKLDPSKMTDGMAEMVLEMMLKDSAYEFDGGVRNYIESTKAVKKTRRQLEHAIVMEYTSDKIMKALKNYDIAQKNLRISVRNIKNEYLFLNGERKIKPPLDGAYVMNKLIKNICKNMSDEDFEDLMHEAQQIRNQKDKT